MYDSLVDPVLQMYNLQGRSLSGAQKGYRNESRAIELSDGRLVNLIFFKNEPTILEKVRLADDLSSYLEAKDLPVRFRLDKRLVKLKSSNQTSYAGLYNYLPGSTISWESYTMKHLKLLGWAMSDLHAAAVGFKANQSPLALDTVTSQLGDFKTYVGGDSVKEALVKKLNLAVDLQKIDELMSVLEVLKADDDHQALHLDMVRGNILFSNATIKDRWQIGGLALSGVIDFEKAAFGPKILDIARTLAFLLVDCRYKSADKIVKYFLISGYNKRGRSSFKMEKSLGGASYLAILRNLVNVYQLHDFYKFLKHTPYESLHQNQHFTHTRDRLIKQAIIQYSSVRRGL